MGTTGTPNTAPIPSAATNPDAQVIWRGKAVPKIVEMWMDQLMKERQMLEYYSANRYIDVTLTMGSALKVAKPPQILLH